MMFGQLTLNMNEVRAILTFKEIQRKVGSKEDNSLDLLFLRGRTDVRSSKEKGKSRSMCRASKKCFHYNKDGHFKKYFP